MADSLQYLRRVKLTVTGAGGGLDLSKMRIRFKVRAADVESPNNADIRIYNLSKSTVDQIIEEFKEIQLEAGYEFNQGLIFKGTLKWYRYGREPNGVDTYLDLLAADGDIPYNQAFISKSFEAGMTGRERILEIAKTMQEKGLGSSPTIAVPPTGGIIPSTRGKVMFGMSRVNLAREVLAMQSTWSIQNNELVVIDKTGYLPGEAVVLNGHSGLIGRPDQTIDGIKAKCLINPKIKVGSLVKLDNASINVNVPVDPKVPVVYDSYTNLQFVANIATDGLYRAYVIEYVGDTRASDWYAELTLLEVDPKENLVVIE